METLGPYQLIRRIAVGGMAEIFLAQQPSSTGSSRYIVIKRILPHRAGDAEFVEMFLNEARLAAMLNHPHIVRIHDLGGEDGVYFIAMEYVQGYDLGQILDRSQEKRQVIPPFLVAKMLGQAGLGLHHAHTYKDPTTNLPLNLIHRDVSLPNVMLTLDGVIKILDFGIAKASTSDQRNQTQAGVLKGKISYMSPEYLMGQEIDWRHDLFALGVMMYEMLTGQKPFDAKGDVQMLQGILTQEPRNPHQFNSSIPSILVDITMKLLAKDREQRYQSGEELNQDLVQASIQHNGYDVTNEQLAQYIHELFMGAPNEVHPISPPQRTPPPSNAFINNPSHPTPERRFSTEEQTGDIPPSTNSPHSFSQSSHQPNNQQQSGLLSTPNQPSWENETRCLDVSALKDEMAGNPHEPLPTPTAALVINPDGSFQTSSFEELASTTDLPLSSSSEEFISTTDLPFPASTEDQESVESPQNNQTNNPNNTENAPLTEQSTSLKKPPLYLFLLVTLAFFLLAGLALWLYIKAPKKRKITQQETLTQQPQKTIKHQPKTKQPKKEKIVKIKRKKPPTPRPSSDMLGARVVIRATSPPCSCSVYWLNKGRRIGRTPLHIRLPAGTHRLALRRRNPRIYYPFTIRIKNGQLYKKYISMNEGLLSLQIQPWAKIYIDGNYLGRTPIQPQRLYPGYHILRMIGPSGRSYKYRLFIRSHQRRTIKKHLK